MKGMFYRAEVFIWAFVCLLAFIIGVELAIKHEIEVPRPDCFQYDAEGQRKC